MSHDTTRARNPWVTHIASKSQTVHGGWRRLVHDMSHSVHRWANPRIRPHDPRHEGIESEMVAYVLASGWLDGKLRPKSSPVPSATERAVVKHGRDLASLARWQSKAKRAANAIAKLQRAIRSHERRAT